MEKSAAKNEFIKYLGVVLLMLLTTSAFAQKNRIKLDLFKPVFGKTSLTYERALNENSSISVEYQFWNLSRSVLTKESYEKEQVGLFKLPLIVLDSYSKYIYTNKGHRFYLEYRNYFSKITKFNAVFYFTGSIFTGRHETNKTLRFPWFINGPARRNYVESKSRSVNSSGAGAGVGIQRKWGAFLLDWNVRLGGAMSNKDSNRYEPAFMHGLFIDSNMAIGIIF